MIRAAGRVAYNATIESFAVHCRALISFFFDHKPKHDTDVIAADFFATPDQWARHHAIDGFFASAQIQANKQIAHITVERRNLNAVGGQDGDWQVTDIVQAICRLMMSFVNSAPNENLDSAAKQKLIELVRQNSPAAVPPHTLRGSQPEMAGSTQRQVAQELTDVRTIGVKMTGKSCP